MSRYVGSIGLATQVDDGTGIWEEVVTERKVRGEIKSISSKYLQKEKLNEDVELNMELSLIWDRPLGDLFSSNMVYVTHLGFKWKVVNIRVQAPRVILSLGGMWNG